MADIQSASRTFFVVVGPLVSSFGLTSTSPAVILGLLMATALMMGLGLGVGALMLTPVGMLADRVGMAAALGAITWLLVPGVFLVMALMYLRRP